MTRLKEIGEGREKENWTKIDSCKQNLRALSIEKKRAERCLFGPSSRVRLTDAVYTKRRENGYDGGAFCKMQWRDVLRRPSPLWERQVFGFIHTRISRLTSRRADIVAWKISVGILRIRRTDWMSPGLPKAEPTSVRKMSIYVCISKRSLSGWMIP